MGYANPIERYNQMHAFPGTALGGRAATATQTQRPHPVVLVYPLVAVCALPAALPVRRPAVLPAGKNQYGGWGLHHGCAMFFIAYNARKTGRSAFFDA